MRRSFPALRLAQDYFGSKNPDLSITKLRSAFQLIPRNRRRKLWSVALIQASLSVFDLIGIALIGVIGALSVSGVKSVAPSQGLNDFLTVIGIEDQGIQSQVTLLGITAAFFLIAKTLVSAFLNKKILKFLSHNTSIVSSDLYGKLLGEPKIVLDGSSSQKALFSVTQGVQSLNVGAIGSFMNIVSETCLLIVLSLGLFVFDWVLALGTILLFGFSAIVIYFALHKKARDLGGNYSRLLIETSDIFIESRSAYRELFTRNQLEEYRKKFSEKRFQLGDNVANSAFMPLLSKYAIEATLIIGALLLTGLQFSRGNAEQAVASLGVFFATSSRLAPSILRMQQSLISMRIALSESAVTMDLVRELESESGVFEARSLGSITESNTQGDFNSEVIVSNVTYAYPDTEKSALKNVSFRIAKGSFTAIVGSSGSGKSTLVDCILGIIEPSQGQVTISGLSPRLAIANWPGRIGYVPQEIYLARKSIAENIVFKTIDIGLCEDHLEEALQGSGALEFVKSLPQGARTEIGEKGSKLSGGQRQRIGIARALFLKPDLLVLDEATSALDSISESAVTEQLLKMHGSRTLIVIAHRLSTVRSADQVIYMKDGKISKSGSFDTLYRESEEFRLQVDSMDLSRGH